MKILYYANIDAFSESGVLIKILNQVQAWENHGHNVKLLVQSKVGKGSNKKSASLAKSNHIIIYSTLARWLVDKGISNLQVLNKILSKGLVKNEIDEFSPDLIYARFALWYPGFIGVFGAYPLIVELNSLDKKEIKTRGKLDTIYHSLTRNNLLRRADAYCSVTDEIARSMVSDEKPGIVIGNAYDVDSVAVENISVDNDRPVLIFVGSSDCPWHGIDKLIQMAELLGYCDFIVVGSHEEYDFSALPNIEYCGPKYGEDLINLYAKSDIAIGSLALYRNEMIEASPLKVREYVSFGLPVIVGYKDTDLEGKDYILDIGCYDNNVMDNPDRIKEFIFRWKGRKIEEDLSYLSYEVKEKKRIEFMKTVCDG